MNAFTIAALSAAEFEIARGVIPELSGCASYDDWLDRRYGRFMGLSTGGAHAELVMVRLGDFLDWCGDREIPANEAALDTFAALRVTKLRSTPRPPLRQDLAALRPSLPFA